MSASATSDAVPAPSTPHATTTTNLRATAVYGRSARTVAAWVRGSTVPYTFRTLPSGPTRYETRDATRAEGEEAAPVATASVRPGLRGPAVAPAPSNRPRR